MPDIEWGSDREEEGGKEEEVAKVGSSVCSQKQQQGKKRLHSNKKQTSEQPRCMLNMEAYCESGSQISIDLLSSPSQGKNGKTQQSGSESEVSTKGGPSTPVCKDVMGSPSGLVIN